MEEKKKSRQVRKTKKSLRQGFVQLISQKGIQNITIKELTELVDIHRGTFYYHYNDIYDLQEQIENDILLEVEEIFTGTISDELRRSPLPVLIEFNEYLDKNREVYQLFLTANETFTKRLTDKLLVGYLREWVKYTSHLGESEDLNYLCDFIMSGYIAILKRWLTNQSSDSPKVLAEKMIAIAVNGMSQYKKLT